MVLQNKYKRAASAKYAQSSSANGVTTAARRSPPKADRAPSPLETTPTDDVEGEPSGPSRSFRRREVAGNEGRYEETELEATESDVEAEEELRREEELEMTAFSEKQRRGRVDVDAMLQADNELDVDTSFAHLHTRRPGRPVPMVSVVSKQDSVQARQLHRDSDRVDSARQLRQRFSSRARNDDDIVASSSSATDIDDLLADVTLVRDTTKATVHTRRPQARLRDYDDLDALLAQS